MVVAKAGYVPQTVEVTTRLNPYGVGDLMENTMSGGLGLIVDAGTGASLEHVPDPVTVTLTRAAK